MNSCQGDGLKIGVFPVRQSAGMGSVRTPDKFLLSLTQALQKELEKAQVGDVVMLAWPEQLSNTAQPTFETLVNRGKEKGCNGVLALQLSARTFTKKDIKVPIVGNVSTAEAAFGVTGGMIDVASSAAVVPIKTESKKTAKPYRGRDPNTVLAASYGNNDFDDSPLADAANDCIRQIVSAVKSGSGNLTPGLITISPRVNTPAGAGFSQDEFQMSMSTGYDKRGTVSVVNRGKQTQTFVIVPKDVPEGLVVGLMGSGSIDGPCTLAPGEWKDIRLVANAPVPVDVKSVSLALYAASGKTPSTEGTPADTATMNIQWEVNTNKTDFVVLGQDPVTLAYTCQIVNKTDSYIRGMTVKLQYGQQNMAWITPNLDNASIPGNGSITFNVIPCLYFGMRELDLTLESHLNNALVKWPLHFVVPDGKSVYLGMGHTSESSSSSASGCVNKGELEFETNWKGQTREEWQRTAYFPQGEDKSENFKWSLRLSKWWYWVLTHINTKEEMDDWHRRDNERDRAADVRGATIRPNVSARLANMDTDCFTHPMTSYARDCRGFVFYTTPPNSNTRVYFVRETPVMGKDSRLDPALLSDKDHNARWPYIRTRWDTSQAFVVWEDSAQGKGSDLAFRGSGRMMQDWSPVQYLTNHGKGVDDPVVHANEQGVVVVVWNDLRDGTGQIYLRISKDSGKTFGPEVAITRSQGESHAWPQIDFVSDGGFALIYVSKTGTQAQIVSRRLDKDGKTRGETAVLSNKNVVCGEPQVVCDASGTVYSVWREGDGDASEIWFSRCPSVGGKWTAPKQLTNDKVYSEYPLIWVNSKTLFASYHTDVDGVTDLKYVMGSHDGGDTWGERLANASMEADAGGRAFVEINFALQNPRSTYHPYTTTVFINGVQIGKLENIIPEGTYIWEVPAGVANCSAQGTEYNNINIKFAGVNGAHYILATNCRLVVQRRYTQLPVVAGSQIEADELAKKSGVSLNHSAPDLALAANAITSLPVTLQPGKSLELPLSVYNLGEATANEVKVCLFAADPRNPILDLKSLNVVDVGTVNPGEMKPVSISFRYDPANIPRVYAAVYSKEKDFNDSDNTWGFSFTKGESDQISPLFGTDIPNVLQAPDLVSLVSIPNVPGLLDLVSLPGLDKLLGKTDFHIPGIKQFTDPLSGVLKGKKIEGLDLNTLFNK